MTIEIKRILYPTDFSDLADHARGYVEAMASEFGAKVTLMHVTFSPSYYEVAYSYELSGDVTKIAEKTKKEAEKKLNELADKIREQGIEVDTVLTSGTPFVDIVKTARASNVDMIILSTHGHGAMKHVLLGSTAERVVRKAPCPVLTVRSPEHEFVHP